MPSSHVAVYWVRVGTAVGAASVASAHDEPSVQVETPVERWRWEDSVRIGVRSPVARPGALLRRRATCCLASIRTATWPPPIPGTAAFVQLGYGSECFAAGPSASVAPSAWAVGQRAGRAGRGGRVAALDRAGIW